MSWTAHTVRTIRAEATPDRRHGAEAVLRARWRPPHRPVPCACIPRHPRAQAVQSLWACLEGSWERHGRGTSTQDSGGTEQSEKNERTGHPLPTVRLPEPPRLASDDQSDRVAAGVPGSLVGCLIADPSHGAMSTPPWNTPPLRSSCDEVGALVSDSQRAIDSPVIRGYGSAGKDATIERKSDAGSTPRIIPVQEKQENGKRGPAGASARERADLDGRFRDPRTRPSHGPRRRLSRCCATESPGEMAGPDATA